MNTPEKVIYKDGECNLQTVVYRDPEGVERCAYTFPYPKGIDKTVTEYLAENSGTICLSFDEALERMGKAEEAAYIKPWTEISEDAWTDALEVLPPQKWKTVDGVELFRMSEYTTGNITTHYARIAGRCFCAGRRISEPYEVMAAQVQDILEAV